MFRLPITVECTVSNSIPVMTSSGDIHRSVLQRHFADLRRLCWYRNIVAQHNPQETHYRKPDETLPQSSRYMKLGSVTIRRKQNNNIEIGCMLNGKRVSFVWKIYFRPENTRPQTSDITSVKINDLRCLLPHPSYLSNINFGYHTFAKIPGMSENFKS